MEPHPEPVDDGMEAVFAGSHMVGRRPRPDVLAELDQQALDSSPHAGDWIDRDELARIPFWYLLDAMPTEPDEALRWLVSFYPHTVRTRGGAVFAAGLRGQPQGSPVDDPWSF